VSELTESPAKSRNSLITTGDWRGQANG